jgi:hypothetical protein
VTLRSPAILVAGRPGGPKFVGQTLPSIAVTGRTIKREYCRALSSLILGVSQRSCHQPKVQNEGDPTCLRQRATQPTTCTARWRGSPGDGCLFLVRESNSFFHNSSYTRRNTRGQCGFPFRVALPITVIVYTFTTNLFGRASKDAHRNCWILASHFRGHDHGSAC